MKCAADFRAIARNSLKGRWGIAILAGLVASFLGAAGSGTFNFNFNVSGNSENSVKFSDFDFSSALEELLPGLAGFLIAFVAIVLIVSLVFAAFFFVLSSIVGVGYAKFNLDLVDNRETPTMGTLCSYTKYWKNLAVANLLHSIYILLWTLLCFIPGIVASYSYAMTSYILADNPELPASEAIARSKEMMQGNRWRLFCLEMSFFGWALVAALTCGIGFLWMTPYCQAAIAAFYREVSGTECLVQPTEPVYLDSSEA